MKTFSLFKKLTVIISMVPSTEASARRAVSLNLRLGEKMSFLYRPRAETMMSQIGTKRRIVDNESIERPVKLIGRALIWVRI